MPSFSIVGSMWQILGRGPFCPPVHSTSWKCSLYFVYIFRTGRNFLIKLCSSDPSLSINILRSLYLKFKTSAHAHIANTYYYDDLEISWHEMNFKFSLVYIMINEVGHWFYQLDGVTFSKNIFWSVNCTLFFYQIYSIQMLTL